MIQLPADSDTHPTHPTRRTGFELFGRDPLELQANVRKVVGMNPTDNCTKPRTRVGRSPHLVSGKSKDLFPCRPFLASCL